MESESISNFFLKLLVVLSVVVMGLKGYATIQQDNTQLTEMKFDELMGERYTEILLVFSSVVIGGYMAVGTTPSV